MEKRASRKDLVFIGVLMLVVLLITAMFALRSNGEAVGGEVIVTIDGDVYGKFSLNTEQEIPIMIDGVTTNLLMISEGVADMTEADCPDQLCVHQASISKNNETIVCLPNKVVVEIAGSEESGLDSIAK